MNYIKAKEYLLSLLCTEDNHKNINNKEFNGTNSVIDTLSNGTQISINYPGYKSYKNQYGYKYDYRVNIIKKQEEIPLSHVNIIVEIYHKIAFCNLDKEEVYKILIEVFKEGVFDLSNYNLNYKKTFPTRENKELLLYVNEEMLKNSGKEFDDRGNQLELTLEEIFTSIKWIALQEDINYPISKGFEGRKMPLARYVETIWSTEKKGLLTQIIARAMNKNVRPKPFNGYDYSFLNEIL